MPKAFLVKKFKGTKSRAGYGPKVKLNSKRHREIRRSCEGDFGREKLYEIKKEPASAYKVANIDQTLLLFGPEKPSLITLPGHHRPPASFQSCLDKFKNPQRSRKEELGGGKKTRKTDAKKGRSYAQNVGRPLILPNEKFEFPKPSGPLPQTQYICQLCKDVYPDPFALAQHRCSGIKHTEYRCPECDKVFSCPANLASHRRWHRPRSPNGGHVAAKKDSSKTTTAVAATIIAATVIAEPRKKNDVSPTAKLTKSAGFLEAGAQDQLDGNGSCVEYACESCDKTFRRKAYLQKHMNSHSDDRPYPCQYCGKVFRSLTNRAKHVLNHAIGTKTFACEVCGNGFPNKGSLERHSRVHGSEVFSCNECSATFYSAPGLSRHATKCHNSNSGNCGQTGFEAVPLGQG